MTELLIIARLKNLTSKDAKQIKVDTLGIGDAAKRASVQQAAMAARTGQLNKKLRELAKEVNAGKLSVQQATTQFKKFEQGLPKIDTNLSAATTQTKSFGSKLSSLTSTIGVVTGAAVAAGAVFKQAFDLAEQGVQIAKTEDRFIALNESVGALADDTLMRLQDATDDSVTAFKLMEGSNLLLSTGVAGTSDELVKLVENVIKLKKPTESAEKAVENFSLLMANQSIPRLDSFGISASAVRGRVDELMEGINGLSKEAAFNTAVMEQMEIAITNVGETADFTADGFTKLGVTVGNASDRFKTFLGKRLEPTANVLNLMVDTVLNSENAWKDLAFIFDELTPKFNPLLRGIEKIKGESEENTEVVIEMTTATRRYGLAAEQTRKRIAGLVKEVEPLNQIMGEQAFNLDEAADRVAFYRANAQDAGQVTDDWEFSVEELNEQLAKQAAIAEEDAEQIKKVEEAAADAAAEQERLAKLTGEYFNEALKATEETSLFGVAIDDLGTKTFALSNLTAGQQANLADLRGEQTKLLSSIRSLEGGTAALGLEEDERLGKLDEQRTALAEVEAAMQPLVNTTGTLVTTTNEATFSLDAVNTRLFEQARAAGLTAEQTALIGVATGQMSEAQAAATVKAAILLVEIDKLVAAFGRGQITADQAAKAAGRLASGVSGTAQQAIFAVKETDLFADSIDRLSEKEARVTVDVEVRGISNLERAKQLLSEVGGGRFAGGGREAAERETFQTGGFTGRGRGIAGTVGRNEFVFDRNATRSLGVPFLESLMSVGQGDTFNDNRTNFGGVTFVQQPGENPEAMIDRTLNELGRRSRQASRSGVGLIGTTR